MKNESNNNFKIQTYSGVKFKSGSERLIAKNHQNNSHKSLKQIQDALDLKKHLNSPIKYSAFRNMNSIEESFIDKTTSSKLITVRTEASKAQPVEIERKARKATDDFLSIIASRLCLLDNDISQGRLKACPINPNDKQLKKLKKSYFHLLKSFASIEGVVDSVYIHSVVLAKKVKNALCEKFEFKQKEFMLVYAGCLFLSIKYVIDSHKWFVEDFANISHLEESLIHKMEIFVLETALDFQVAVLGEEFFCEYDKTYRNVEKRKHRLKKNKSKGCHQHQ